jgi:quercetin dioxygenase-like cupin family protein
VEVLSWDDIAEERVNENITRKMVWGENLMMARFHLAPGSVIPMHDHLAEQMTTVLEGSVTLSFPGEDSITLRKGEMVIIPASKPHGSVAGSEGCIALDIFSPVRQDFIDAKGTGDDSPEVVTEAAAHVQEPEPAGDPYERLHGVLAGVGIRVPLEELRQMPLDLLARYVYEKECITMGELRRILGYSKEQAKGLLRQWKHGDDHSEASLKRKMERLIVLPSEFKLFRPE